MAHKWDDVDNRDDSSADPDLDFESFLRKKVEECTQDVPTSQLTTTGMDLENAVNHVNQPPVDAVEESSEQVTSQQTPEENLPSEPLHVSGAEERDIISKRIGVETATELEVREHPVAGTHVVEKQVVLTVDAEWVRISNESYTMAIVEMTTEYGDKACEKIIDRIHDLNRLRFLIPAQQFGLQNALEELLKSRNAEDRAKLTALMSENYRKLKQRSQPKQGAPKKAKDKKVGSGVTGAAGKGQKAAKQFHTLGFDIDFAIEKLKLQGLYDDATAAYVRRLYDAA